MIKVKNLGFLYLIYTFALFFLLKSSFVRADMHSHVSHACCVYQNEATELTNAKDALKLICSNSIESLVANKHQEQENLYISVMKTLNPDADSLEVNLYKALKESYDSKTKKFIPASKSNLAHAYEAKYGRKCELKGESSFKVFTASTHNHESYKRHKLKKGKKRKKPRKKDQEPDALSFGLIAGVNMTFYDLSGTYRSYDRKSILGFQAGLTAMLFFSESFGVGTGLIYQNRGVEFYDVNYDLAERNYHYLEIPLTVGYDMHHIVKVYGGFQFSMFMSGTRKSSTLGTTAIDKNEMNTFTMSILVGSLFHIFDDLFFDLSYVYGLQDEKKNITNKNRAIQASLAYYL